MKDNQFKLFPFTINDKFKAEDVNEIPLGVSMIKAPEFWGKGNKGKDVKIAIIDTGCDINHPDLNGRIIGGKNFTSDDNADPDKFNDYSGHGTHVAGTIAAIENGKGVVGVAPESSLLILKALAGKDGVGDYDWVINAINYAVEQKVDVISMSLSGANDVLELHESIQKAVQNNILVVCAAGNESEGDTSGNIDEIGYPSYYNEVISVGAVDSTRSTTIFTNSNKEVDLVAPDTNITSTFPNNKYATLSGTSMATPHVSGALALIINWAKGAFGRNLNEVELYAQLIKRTVSLDYKKTIVGNGLIYLIASEVLEDFLKNEPIN